MRPITDGCHKTLIEIGGRTILGRIVDGLLENGISSIVCVTGYRATEVEGYLLRAYPAIDLVFVRNERYRETNNIFSLSLALERMPLDEDVLLIESDIVCDPSVFARLVHTPHPNVALVDRFRPGLDGTVVSIADGIVTSVIPPHLQTGDFSFTDKYKTLNIYKFSRAFCQSTLKRMVTYYANTIDANCYYELVLGILIYVQHAVIHAEFISSEQWAEVDDPNDLRIAEFLFNPASQAEHLAETMGGYWSLDITDFCFIRNMYFPTAAMLAELKSALPQLIQNYGSRQRVLNQKLAYFLLCHAERVQVLNGASQIFPMLADWFGNRPALLPRPTFGEYAQTFPIQVPYPDDGRVDFPHLEEEARSAAVVVFVNPNNPTGTTLPARQIFDFACRHADKTIIVDESFVDFSAQESLIGLLERHPLPNVLVLKSLSKTLGIPGLRLGFVYTCNAEWHTQIGRHLPIWNLNSVAEYVLEIILKHRQSYADSLIRTIADRESFARDLAALPLVSRVLPSGGNFLLITLREGAPRGELLRNWLLARYALYIKDVSPRLADGRVYLRLAVRLPHENARLCAALAIAEQERSLYPSDGAGREFLSPKVPSLWRQS